MAGRRPSKRSPRSRRKSARRPDAAARAVQQDRSIVGDLVNFRGLVYAPVNESGVVFLFGKVAGDLNMYVEEVKTGFPDCIARRFTGKGWERVRVELEFKSSNFRGHGHDAKECDIIVCWEHDWPACPIEVIELRERIKELPSEPPERPGATEAGPQGDIAAWLKKYSIKPKVAAMFDMLWDHIHRLDESTFYKVGDRNVSFYSPQRAFIFLDPRKNILRLHLFTGGKKLGKVKQFEFERGAEKWGGFSVSSEAELRAALPWVTESLRRIREAIKRNEPTGYSAKLDAGDED